MRRTLWITLTLLFGVASLYVLAVESDGQPYNISIAPMRGSVELISNHRATQCTLWNVRGGLTRELATQCDGQGSFEFVADRPRDMVVRVFIPETQQTLERRILMPFLASTSRLGGSVQMPPIVMTGPTTVAGQVRGITPENHGGYFVTIPAFNAAAPLSPSGTFLLGGLPPGRHTLELWEFEQLMTRLRSARAKAQIDVRAGEMSFHEGLHVFPKPPRERLPGDPKPPIR